LNQSAALPNAPQVADLFVQVTFHISRVLRRIFGRSRDEVTGEWRRLHNEGVKVEKNDMGWACGAYG